MIAAASAAVSGARVEVNPIPANAECSIPLFAAAFHQAPAAGNAGVVDQQVNASGVVLGRDFVPEAEDLRFIGHVHQMRRDARSKRPRLELAESLRLGHAIHGQIANCNVAAFAGELPGEFAPYPAASAGHNCNPAGQVLHFARWPSSENDCGS
jgi:hypothetical protein